MLEAIWQVMPNVEGSGALWTTTGDLALPLLTTERELAEGDVLWTDVEHHLLGVLLGLRAHLVGRGERPRRASTLSSQKWREILDAVLAVTKAGATSGDLARAAIAANGGSKPWLPHFYLGHGIGTNAAEMPMIGTDLGPGVRRQLRLTRQAWCSCSSPSSGRTAPAAIEARRSSSSPRTAIAPITDYPYARTDPYGD